MTEAKLLSRNDILSANDTISEEVNVPEWGGKVLVKALSGAERDEFESSIVGEKVGKHARTNMKNVRARLVALTVVDDAGKPVFKTSDITALGEKSAAALDRVFSVAQRLAGISDSDVEDLEANFT